MTKLSKIIDVDKDKCLNCHACIAACPVKNCNDGSGDYISLNHNMCIGCGSCITACTHEARYIIDDFDSFITDINSGKKMIAFVAPAAASNWPDQYLNLNGWLKSIGVEAVFDVSFGGELTARSYLEEIKKNDNQLLISQPCPAIVSFIQIYLPNLLDNLVKVDSPMLHAIKMVKRFYTQYANHRIAVISPCIAKKREFKECGLGDYNVTFKSLKKHFEQKGIDLLDYPEQTYNNPPSGRGVGFPSPGGLIKLMEKYFPKITSYSRKIEGPNKIYEYLKQLSLQKDNLPKQLLLLDCLNCELGCNGGTGTDQNNMIIDEIEKYIRKRIEEAEKFYSKQGILSKFLAKRSLKKYLNKFWKKGLFSRNYINLELNNTIAIPSDNEINTIYKKMKKHDKNDILNCSACGYHTCKDMAIAIYNGLNRPENCHHFRNKLIEEDNDLLREKEKQLNQNKIHLEEKVMERTKQLTDVNEKLKSEVAAHQITEESLRESEHRLRLKLDYLMSPEKELKTFSLTDLIDLQTLQEIQDTFSITNGVASLISDPHGTPITQPSNFSAICTTIRGTDKGLQQCVACNKELGNKTLLNRRPTYEQCKNCTLLDGSASIIVEGQHIANWMIGQIKTKNSDRKSLEKYAKTIGADTGKILKEYDALPEMPVEQFKHILELLGCLAKNLSSLGYNNLKLVKDIIEKERLEQEILSTRKLESIGILAGGIAHDFNNLLTSILGNISIAMLDTQDENLPIAHTLENAEKAALRAKELSNQLLTFSKGGTPVKTTTSIKELLEESARFVLKGSNVNCIFEIDDDLWPVEVDSGQINQVINNLIINASQAMPNGGSINVACQNVELDKNQSAKLKAGKYIRIIIQDRGMGIPKENLEKIFDPYFTTKKTGSGLGLATSYSIISKHEGNITCESEVGVGTTFTIYLKASNSVLQNKKSATKATVTGTGRILIMDDDKLIQDVFHKTLSKLGYETVCVANGNLAIEEYTQAIEQNKPYDIVIMDLTVPGEMGGKEAIGILKEQFPEIKSVVSSGYSNDPVVGNFEQYGFVGYIKKPFQIQELSNLITSILNS